MRGFKIGDSVRIARGSMLASAHPDLSDKVGNVIELVLDGTSLEPITVAYDGSAEFVGMYAGVFDQHPRRLEVV